MCVVHLLLKWLLWFRENGVLVSSRSGRTRASRAVECASKGNYITDHRCGWWLEILYRLAHWLHVCMLVLVWFAYGYIVATARYKAISIM